MDRRFEFGRNWQKFLDGLSDERIEYALASLRTMLCCADLCGQSFLDVGCGSGLFSLAARRLGASVRSFDYDQDSVTCARSLKDRYYPNDPHWTIEQASALDEVFMRTVGHFDVVYAWGVLHHTGAMWSACDNVCAAVVPNGRLFVALYNDQGMKSKIWRVLKRSYCSGWPGRFAVTGACVPALVSYGFVHDVASGRNPLTRYTSYQRGRGMSVLRDWADWLGGYPFEVARAPDVVKFYEARGFRPERVITTTNLGNHEFVFRRVVEESGACSPW